MQQRPFLRYKVAFRYKTRARLEAGQIKEGGLGAHLLNRMRALSRPSTVRVI